MVNNKNKRFIFQADTAPTKNPFLFRNAFSKFFSKKKSVLQIGTEREREKPINNDCSLPHTWTRVRRTRVCGQIFLGEGGKGTMFNRSAAERKA